MEFKAYVYQENRQAQQKNEGFLVCFFYFFLPCLAPECWGAEGQQSTLINIARNMQLLALGAADSILRATREHPFHLPRIFGDVFFLSSKQKPAAWGAGDPQSSLHPCHPSFPSERLKPGMTEHYPTLHPPRLLSVLLNQLPLLLEL